jgi:hypothetical protein
MGTEKLNSWNVGFPGSYRGNLVIKGFVELAGGRRPWPRQLDGGRCGNVRATQRAVIVKVIAFRE